MNTQKGNLHPKEPLNVYTHELDIAEVARTLWQGRMLILVLGVIAMLLGGIYGFRIAQPRYGATTTLVLQQRNEPVVDLAAVMSNMSTEQSSLNTELHVIRSRGLVEQLVDRLALVDDPEFNPEIRELSPLSPARIKQQLRDLLTPGSKATRPPIDGSIRDKVVRNVQEAINARVQRNTYLFVISVTSLDREKAAKMANTLAQLYIGDQVQTKFAAVESAVQWLSERVSSLEQELRVREDAVANLRARTALTSAKELELRNAQLKDTRHRLSLTIQNADAARRRLDAFITAKEAGDIALVARSFGDAVLQNALAQGAPESSIQTRLSQIETRESVALHRLTVEKNTLLKSEVELTQEIDAQASDLAHLQQLEREAQATRVLYESFLTRLKEASVQRGLQQADSRVLSQAVLGTYVSPQKTLILILSLFAGMATAGAFILIRQFWRSNFRSAEELEAFSGKPVLGQLPTIPIKDPKELIAFLNNQPTAPAAEAMRNLRTSLLMSGAENPPQVILSTSSVPGEGKTTQSIALAHSLAALGKRVLLIEGDISRHAFVRYFPSDVTQGIVSVLSGTCTLSEAVIHEPSLNADVLFGEVSRPHAADMFSSDRLEDLITQARAAYDMVVIDSPPVLVVPDARVIARHADATLYSVAWNQTRQSQIREGLHQFEMVNTPVYGLVLSKIDPSGMARFSYAGNQSAYAACAS